MINEITNVDCLKTRISSTRDGDLVCIEHFGQDDSLLCQIFMDCDSAYDYAKSIVEMADRAMGIE